MALSDSSPEVRSSRGPGESAVLRLTNIQVGELHQEEARDFTALKQQRSLLSDTATVEFLFKTLNLELEDGLQIPAPPPNLSSCHHSVLLK